MVKTILLFFTASFIGSVISKIILSLGFSYLTFIGFDALLEMLFSHVKNSISGLPYTVLCFLGLANFDLALNLIFSAYSARILAIQVTRLTLR